MIKKKYMTLLAASALALSVSACGSSREENETQNLSEEARTQDQEPAEGDRDADAAGESGGGAQGNGDSRILIAYFTAAENSGVDAEASASYSDVDGEAKGRMQALAEMIQAETGGDLFSIQTEEIYPADGGELIDYAADELDEDARPELSTHIENLDDYDTIFVGYPNWWADLPMPLYTFFDEYDFSGKTIIPFNSHNGSRFSGTIQTIEEMKPDATVIEDGFTVNERDISDAAGDIADWINELGY
nr:flavodoxin [uncultured Mediterraneibacter sp.]